MTLASPRGDCRPTRRDRLGPVIAGGLLLGGSGLLATLLAGGASASSKPASAPVASVVSAAKKAILEHSSVKVVSLFQDTANHTTIERTVVDLGRDSGDRTIVAGAGAVRVLLTPTYAYFAGNKLGLTDVFGMPADDQAKVGSKWVSVKRGESAYANFSSTVIASLPTDILPRSSSVKLTTAEVNGRRVHVLRWSTTVNHAVIGYVLDLAATGAPLPVRETVTSGTNLQASEFGSWDERLLIAAPSRTVPYKSLSPT